MNIHRTLEISSLLKGPRCRSFHDLQVWMAFLLACVPYAAEIDKFCRADSRSIGLLASKLDSYNQDKSRYSGDNVLAASNRYLWTETELRLHALCRITTFADFSTLGLM